MRVTGEIGPLRVDVSERAAVVAFAGTPDEAATGIAVGGYAPYRALGYECRPKPGVFTWQLVRGGPSCRTVFFLDRRAGKLEIFFTSSPDYSDGHGVRVGMAQAEAERRLRERLTIGCTAPLHFDSPTGSMSISFGGGVAHGTSIEGAHVDAIFLHSKRRDAGVFDCL